jgi:hypothetical protein
MSIGNQWGVQVVASNILPEDVEAEEVFAKFAAALGI